MAGVFFKDVTYIFVILPSFTLNFLSVTFLE
jgi:hypothetical protein